MSKTAIVSPDELIRFSKKLKQISANLTARKRQAAALVAESAEIWRDAKYDRFEHAFSESVKVLDRFARQADDYADFLGRKATAARKYLDRR